jgi:vacuolar-type H+-ATPase subunit F/Vma7
VSRLLVITRPELVAGFHLAGVDAYGAADVESAQELIAGWWDEDEVNLLAIDDGLLARMDPAFINRLESCVHLLYLAIPGGQPLGLEASRSYRISEIVRRAVGFHIAFKGEEAEG